MRALIAQRPVRLRRDGVERLDQRNAPIVATINPTQQVTNLFYDILYYDSYAPFFRTVGILLTMAVLALALATVFLRRQRYAHL